MGVVGRSGTDRGDRASRGADAVTVETGLPKGLQLHGQLLGGTLWPPARRQLQGAVLGSPPSGSWLLLSQTPVHVRELGDDPSLAPSEMQSHNIPMLSVS